MLIDEFLPRYDVSERHEILVSASAETTYAALFSSDFAQSKLIRTLLFVRSQRLTDVITVATLETSGFRILASDPNREVLIGIEGQFWKLTGNVCTPPGQTFRSTSPPPGFARAVWNFSLEPMSPGLTRLVTATRVFCADAATRRHFLPYWYVIRLGSGLIRQSMLAVIKRKAEAR